VATDIFKDHGTFALSGAANPVTKCKIQEDMNLTVYQLIWFNPFAPELLFLILVHPVYKM